MSGTGNTTITVTASGDQTIDGLINDAAWADSEIFYAFSISSSPYDYSGTGIEDLPANFNTISTQQHTALRFALDSDIGPTASRGFSVEGFTNLIINSLGDFDSTTAELRFGESSSSNLTSARVGDFPGSLVSPSLADDGDVWFGTFFDYRSPEAGNNA